MTLLERAVYLIAGLILLLATGFVFAYWWTSRVPSHPTGVRADAVFLWAPAVGLPAPRRGDWIACWEEAPSILCQLNNIDGTPEYKGEFVPYGENRSIPPTALKIDSEKTREDAVWVGDALVPLVHLQNGDILVPASKYDEGVRLLQKRGRSR
jgi:hypothetical protein